MSEALSLWKHVQTGGLYELIAVGQMAGTSIPVVVYRSASADHGAVWVCTAHEFYSGRFERVRPAPK